MVSWSKVVSVNEDQGMTTTNWPFDLGDLPEQY